MNTFTSTVLNTMRPNQANGQQTADSGNDTPWLIGTTAKVVGSVAGVVSCFMGFLNILYILDIKCMVVGVLLMIEGFFMVLTEAPCCCVFLDFAYMPATMLDKRPHWIKATIYLFFAALPFLWCAGFSTFLSCGLIMATSALYLLIALGKKANRDEMRVKSAGAVNGTSNASQPVVNSAPTAVLVQNEELPAPTIKTGANSQVIY